LNQAAKSKSLPIHILSFADDLEHLITAPFLFFLLKPRHLHVKNGKDKIVPTKLRLALEERLKFKLAMFAANRVWGHDRNEEHRLGDRFLDFLFPQGTLRNSRSILPQPKITAELHIQFAIDTSPQLRQRSSRMLVIPARIAEKSNKFFEIRQRRHRN